MLLKNFDYQCCGYTAMQNVRSFLGMLFSFMDLCLFACPQPFFVEVLSEQVLVRYNAWKQYALVETNKHPHENMTARQAALAAKCWHYWRRETWNRVRIKSAGVTQPHETPALIGGP